MLVGISGPVCAGKHSVGQILEKVYGFTELSIGNTSKFLNLLDLVQFATNNWNKHFYVISIEKYPEYELALKRPFFLLLWVDAPTLLRFNRTKLANLMDYMHINTNSASPCELFIEFDDNQTNQNSMLEFLNHAKIRINNDFIDLKQLESHILDLNILNPDLLRPNWDTYFMGLCELASHRSNCMKRRVGCVITLDHRVISTGYNGTPKGIKNCNEGGCRRCNSNSIRGSALDLCVCIHAEENALLEAGRSRLSNQQVTLYCTTCPCLGCAKKIIQVGVSEIVYGQDYGMDDLTFELLQEAGVKLRKIPPVTIKIY